MPIDSAAALRSLPARRFLRAILLFAALGPPAAAGAPAALEAALKNFRADAPRGWSYHQTTAAEGKSTVERHDAAKPEFDRWTLQLKDGRAPTPDETREYFEARSRRSRGGTAPRLVEQLDLATAETLSHDDGRTTFRCRLKPGESGDHIAEFLRATVVVHDATATIEILELSSTGPFRPTFGVKILEMTTRLTYSLPAGDAPSLPQKVATRVRGTAFWLKSLDAEMTVIFSDYTRAAKRGSRPAAPLLPTK